MNTTATLQQLKELKLAGMARSYESILQLTSHQQPDSHTLVAERARTKRVLHDDKSLGASLLLITNR